MEFTENKSFGPAETHDTIPGLSYQADKLLWCLLQFGIESYTGWLEIGEDAYDNHWNFAPEDVPNSFRELELNGYLQLRETKDKSMFSLRIEPKAIDELSKYLNQIRNVLQSQ